LSKKRSGDQTFFSTTPYAAIPTLGVFKQGALHPVTSAPIKALPCLCFFRRLRKNPSHPLCVWSVTRNIIMESGEILL